MILAKVKGWIVWSVEWNIAPGWNFIFFLPVAPFVAQRLFLDNGVRFQARACGTQEMHCTNCLSGCFICTQCAECPGFSWLSIIFFWGGSVLQTQWCVFFFKSNLCDLWTFPISCFLDQFRSLILLSCDKFFLSACHFQRRWGTRNSLLVLEQPTGLVRDSRPTRPCPESFSILHIRVALYRVFQKHIWKKTKKTKTKLGCTLTEFYRNCKAESRWLIVSKKKVG